MPTLPASYATGIVVFSALISLGDITGDGSVDPQTVNGTITFSPEKGIYKAATYPTVIVGNAAITSKVVNGELVRATGVAGEVLPVGRWHATFDLPGMNVPGVVFDVQISHTNGSPLDLGSLVDLPLASSDLDDLDGTEKTMMIVTDTGDGGFLILGQEFVDGTGAIRTVSITDNTDGSADLDIGMV